MIPRQDIICHTISIRVDSINCSNQCVRACIFRNKTPVAVKVNYDNTFMNLDRKQYIQNWFTSSDYLYKGHCRDLSFINIITLIRCFFVIQWNDSIVYYSTLSNTSYQNAFSVVSAPTWLRWELDVEDICIMSVLQKSQFQTHHWHCKLLRGIISLSLMLSRVEKPPALAKSQIFIILSDWI